MYHCQIFLFSGKTGEPGDIGAKGDHGDNFAIDYNFIGDKGTKGQPGERGKINNFMIKFFFPTGASH